MSALTKPTTASDRLAIEGGTPVRSDPMPPRLAVGPAERAMIAEVLDHYERCQLDPGYQGDFEERYCAAFAAFMGGGHADAVATGTVSLFVALAALDLPKGSEVIVSPITDPGTLSAIILNGLKPKLADSAWGQYNATSAQIIPRFSDQVSAVLPVHAAGRATDANIIVDAARARGIKVLEDCSQAHGARRSGRLVGTFGDMAAFSTMYRKTSIAGSSGGVVFTRDEALYRRALAHADRGKPRWRQDFDDRDPTGFLFPALNLHTDEISCAIGLASLARLEETRTRRLAFVRKVTELLEAESATCRTLGYDPDDSPFITPVMVDESGLACTKTEFAEAVRAEGIGLNPHYMYVVCDWPWVAPHLADDFDTENARDARDRSFCLYLNENYGEREALDVVEAVLKVERHYGAG